VIHRVDSSRTVFESAASTSEKDRTPEQARQRLEAQRLEDWHKRRVRRLRTLSRGAAKADALAPTALEQLRSG
jgi:hypothetical protein